MLRMGQNFSDQQKLARVEEVMLEAYFKKNFAFKIYLRSFFISLT